MEVFDLNLSSIEPTGWSDTKEEKNRQTNIPMPGIYSPWDSFLLVVCTVLDARKHRFRMAFERYIKTKFAFTP